MALINFSRKDFVNAVADGSKHFTIRQLRKKSIKKKRPYNYIQAYEPSRREN